MQIPLGLRAIHDGFDVSTFVSLWCGIALGAGKDRVGPVIRRSTSGAPHTVKPPDTSEIEHLTLPSVALDMPPSAFLKAHARSKGSHRCQVEGNIMPVLQSTVLKLSTALRQASTRLPAVIDSRVVQVSCARNDMPDERQSELTSAFNEPDPKQRSRTAAV